MQAETTNCQNCKNAFIIEAQDFDFYKKIDVPPPTWCPACRLMRRLAFRNERYLYKKSCGLCGKSVMTTYAPNSPYTIYCDACWWSDKWDAVSYGQVYDPNRSFFEQFEELSKKVPHQPVFNLHTTLVNSEYTNLVTNLKNCYLIFNSDYDENCAYGTEVESSKDCFDCLMVDSCELSYESVNCQKCYRVMYSLDSEACSDVWFSKNCVGSSNCFGCINLRNKKYHIWNEPYSEEEYHKKVKEILSSETLETLIKKRDEFARQFPVKYFHGRQNQNISGDYIYNSKNTHDSYIVTGGEDNRYCMWLLVPPVKDCMDFTEFGDGAELMYETITSGIGSSRVKFSRQCSVNDREVEYSLYSRSSHDLFGCVSLQKKEYCILNKEYSKEEYEKLRTQIVEDMKRRGEYGEFFPIATSQFAYNESSAFEHFPMTREEVLKKGWQWCDPEKRDITIGGDILGCAHEGACEHHCTTGFRVIDSERNFLERFQLPLPRLCPNCRHYDRLQYRNPVRLWSRSCMCTKPSHTHRGGSCPNNFKTSYAPNRPEIVYCEQCYQIEVV